MELKEQWKQIEGFPDYEISNFGNVASRKFGKYRVLESSRRTEYLVVKLSSDGKPKGCHIAHLVWDAFGNSKRNGHKLQVDHKDADKFNNKIGNLQLLNNRQNVTKNPRGWEHGNTSKYTGVCLDASRKESGTCYYWKSQMTTKGGKLNLGYFKTELEAHQAYQNKLAEINEGIL